ncbi:MAG: YebC/PmpR family DNA-binding transcriptional regulator [Limnohabitans sp.]
MENAGMLPAVAEITYRADSTVALHEEERLKMQKIIDSLEDLDDVQEVYHNAEL